MTSDTDTIDVAMMTVSETLEILRLVTTHILQEGRDYDKAPGSRDKLVLLKPGAEKLAQAFRCYPKFAVLHREINTRDPFVYYEVECTLIHRDTNLPLGTGIGVCHTQEKKYAWRWVPEGQVPARLDKSALMVRGGRESEFAFALEKAETSGPYGKPTAYWDQWKADVESGAAIKIKKTTKSGKMMDAYERDSTVFAIPNPEALDSANTCHKMAQKRAFVAAVVVATGASEGFTQDEEFMNPDKEYVEAPSVPLTYDEAVALVAEFTDKFNGNAAETRNFIVANIGPSSEWTAGVEAARILLNNAFAKRNV